MEHVQHLVVGAGMSGLAYANFAGRNLVAGRDLLILEADSEPGGYCKTVVQDGFVWDYSGHFFHFKHPAIERYLVERMPAGSVQTIHKSSKILFGGQLVEFPFQKNIHQLPQADFVECLYDLYFKDEGVDARRPPAHFEEMLYRKFGRGIAEKFLIPYNTKLYACSLRELDVEAMGRFFPYAETADIIRNFRQPDNASYNATFTYPRGGAIEYVRALLHDLPANAISYGERLVAVDPVARVATTNRRQIGFDTLVSSAPFNQLAAMCGVPVETPLTWNKVLVFNLGFDRKGWENIHWLYVPDPSVSFYRVGFYDNIFHTDRMSLYIEIGLSADASVDVDAARTRVLADLARIGVVNGHTLVSEHNIVLDPAYVHITKAGQAAVTRSRAALATRGIYSIGRYGGWTYCSIEDNILEARDLAASIRRGQGLEPLM